MVEIVGVVLLFALILVSAVAYLFVYYYRYRWQTRWLIEENRRLKEQVYDLQRDNELLRGSLVLQPGDRPERGAGDPTG